MFEDLGPYGQLIGNSVPLRNLCKRIESLSAKDTPILLVGERGSGKKTSARNIHLIAFGRKSPLIVLHCNSPGDQSLLISILGTSENTTLYLDKINLLSAESQSILFEFLSSGRAVAKNIYLIASVYNLECDGWDSRVYDLFTQNVIEVPPLRERKSDIIDIAYYYLNLYAREYHKTMNEISAAAKNFMMEYGWPDNVRELKDLIHHIVRQHSGRILTHTLLPQHIGKMAIIPNEMDFYGNIHLPFAQIERNIIMRTIDYCSGNVSKAAKILDLSPSTIYRKIAEWGKDKPDS